MQGGSTDFREAPPPTLSTDTPKAGSAASEEAGEEQVGAGSRLTQGSDQMLAAVLTQGYQNQGQAVSVWPAVPRPRRSAHTARA